MARVQAELRERWPESRLDPTLDRIKDLVDLLGEPQRGYPVIHIGGTNGKTTTARIIDAVLRGFGLRVGRFTSPDLSSVTERISLDGEPISARRFVETYDDIRPYLALVDKEHPVPLSYFEVLTAMGFAAFADAPVDVAVVEVGMGGAWDSTNVVDGRVCVVTPVALDHTAYLGDTLEQIAAEKAGIIKPGSAVVLAEQPPEVADVLLQRAAEVGASVVREGSEFGVVSRVPGVGGQMLSLQGLRATYDDVFLPLFGAHQAQNAVVALAAVESFTESQPLDAEIVRAAFAGVTSPARLEIIRRSPTIVLDAAHNPHGAEATAAALEDSFTFSPLVGVMGVMADKDAEGVLAAFEPHLAHLVCTQNSTDRAMPAAALAETAREIFGDHRVTVAPRLADAIDQAATLAEAGAVFGGGVGSGAVLVTGSVITAGEARTMLKGRS
ncbi:MAG: bifunctional folylpolyglutamate synthase/dihydrofolate synthase [Nocardioides sp.]